MEWRHYWQHVVCHYLIVIEGWPTGLVPFKSLSEISVPLTNFEALLELKQYWPAVTKMVSDYPSSLLLV